MKARAFDSVQMGVTSDGLGLDRLGLRDDPAPEAEVAPAARCLPSVESDTRLKELT